jgi:hypothetical protein
LKGKADVVFAVLLGLVGLWMVWQARSWPFSARLVPLAIGIPFLLLVTLLLLTFVIEHRARRRAVAATGIRGTPHHRQLAASDQVDETESDASVYGYAAHAVWFAVFVVAVWALGFALGGTLSVAAYLIYTRSHWRTVVILTLFSAGFFWAASEWMKIRFPKGMLW